MSDLNIEEISAEAFEMAKANVRGQHSNSKVIRLCSEIKSLRAELSRLREQTRWPRFGDEQPEEGATVIVQTPNGYLVAVRSESIDDDPKWRDPRTSWDLGYCHPDDLWQYIVPPDAKGRDSITVVSFPRMNPDINNGKPFTQWAVLVTNEKGQRLRFDYPSEAAANEAAGKMREK